MASSFVMSSSVSKMPRKKRGKKNSNAIGHVLRSFIYSVVVNGLFDKDVCLRICLMQCEWKPYSQSILALP